MNNRGMNIGGFFILFLGIIVGLVLVQAIAQQVGSASDTLQYDNRTYTASATIGTYTDTIGQEITSGFIMTNATSGGTVPSTNYTTSSYVSPTTGLLTAGFTMVDDNDGYDGQNVNVSYLGEPEGYIADSASRTIFVLIILLSALGLLAFIIWRSEIGEALGI